MKQIIIISVFMLFSVYSYAQWDPNGNNSTTGNLYVRGQAFSLGTENTTNYTQFFMHLKPQDKSNGEVAFRYGSSSEKTMIRSEYIADKGGILEFHTFPKGSYVRPRMIITGDGLVGIGTSDPLEMLDVAGGIRGTKLRSTGDISAVGKVFAQGVTIGSENSGLTQFYMQMKPQDKAYGEFVFRYAAADKKAVVRSEYYANKGANLEFCTFPAGGSVSSKMMITGAGLVGIGTREPLDKLDVRGGIRGTTLNLTGNMNSKNINADGIIRAREVKIELTGWSDFVFTENYKLLSLSEVENHVKLHKHLPDIPSEEQVLKEGISVGEMQAKLLQKIEELTLYVIEQDKQNKELKSQLDAQNKEIEILKSKID